jgi:phage-related protein
MALFKDQGEIDNILFHAGRITISFDCKPQRFLKSGDETITIEEGITLRNPTIYKANPIITVYGTVTGGIAEVINIGDYSVSINEIDEYVTIDSSIFDVYKKTPTGIVNKNSTVNFTNGYPKIQKGEVPITFTSGITKVEVVPRWWTL